jgi:hypothetical protein
MPEFIAARGKVRVVLDNDCHEGIDGEYNPQDPADIPLMRFNVDVKKGREWVPIDDSSYCTQIDARLPAKEHQRLAELLLGRVYDAVVFQTNGVRTGVSVKKLCEGLSWINQTWGTKSEKQGWVLG